MLAAGVAIHGIEPHLPCGQPTTAAVTPAFRAFAHDSVPVAYNAAYDMRFLQLEEAVTGVRFEPPVRDTLLLSAVPHPEQGMHSLEAMCERLSAPRGASTHCRCCRGRMSRLRAAVRLLMKGARLW